MLEDPSNKEIIERLIAYYRKQDVEVIYRLLANAQIDYNRLDMFDMLAPGDKAMLLTRIQFNARALRAFIKEGDQGKPLKITNVDDL